MWRQKYKHHWYNVNKAELNRRRALNVKAQRQREKMAAYEDKLKNQSSVQTNTEDTDAKRS